MPVEPTDTESKAGLDQFTGALRSVAERGRRPQVRPALRVAPQAGRNRRRAHADAGTAPLADEDD
jgi:glycine dehydrogenase subunit 2